MSDQPQPPQRIYAKWVPEVGEWDLWDEHYGHDDDDIEYVPASQRDELEQLFLRSEWLQLYRLAHADERQRKICYWPRTGATWVGDYRFESIDDAIRYLEDENGEPTRK